MCTVGNAAMAAPVWGVVCRVLFGLLTAALPSAHQSTQPCQKFFCSGKVRNSTAKLHQSRLYTVGLQLLQPGLGGSHGKHGCIGADIMVLTMICF